MLWCRTWAARYNTAWYYLQTATRTLNADRSPDEVKYSISVLPRSRFRSTRSSSATVFGPKWCRRIDVREMIRLHQCGGPYECNTSPTANAHAIGPSRARRKAAPAPSASAVHVADPFSGELRVTGRTTTWCSISRARGRYILPDGPSMGVRGLILQVINHAASQCEHEGIVRALNFMAGWIKTMPFCRETHNLIPLVCRAVASHSLNTTGKPHDDFPSYAGPGPCPDTPHSFAHGRSVDK